MQRLYVGGLSHTVTQKDLKDRFGKFGDVEDVELRIRKDAEGVPYKTFAYINISISDANLKKCLTVLNKSKWKGGTLRIEAAKESFLKRLAEERRAAAEQGLQPSSAEDKRQKLLDSLRGAGVENFTMRAAVPGTEVPGHKNWVVSKFGRVLPVLQLSHQKGVKLRSMKYDPSKYSHNIHRLEQWSPEWSTPVTRLTWELQGGDSDISKKRRGEFPPFHPVGPKRSYTDKPSDQDPDQPRTRRAEQDADPRPKQPMADVTDSVVEEADENGFEEVGCDYVLKSCHSCLQEEDDEDEDDEESSGCSSDSDYDALFSNGPLVKISLADLQKLSEESQRSCEAAEEEPPAEAPRRLPKKGTTPEQILASILEESRKEELKEARMRRKTGVKMTLPPFQGTRALREEEEGGGEGNEEQLHSDLPQLNHRTMEETLSRQRNVEREIGESSDEDEENDASGAGKALPDTPEALTKPPETVAPSAHHREASSTEEEEEEQQQEEEEEEEEQEEEQEEDEEEQEEQQQQQASSQPVFKRKEDVEQQRKDNVRRLAAIQQRREEAEGHRKVIQSALAQLDASAPAAGTHIIFDSDEEDQRAAATSKKTSEDGQSEDGTSARSHKVKPSAPQLFADMDDDDEDSDEDDGRFDIRPQFEGRAGQKLMALQSRFGTDERFRMDARFLEDDEDRGEDTERRAVVEAEAALEEEKKSNLSILHSVLGSSQQTSSKAKTFRDISALHYDPTRAEHIALETSSTATKESKSARRKKREEAEKVPEVSKEIYYDVFGDLKAAFGQKKDGKPEEEEKMNWDQHVEEEEEEELPESCQPADSSLADGESSGFHFSFFGDEAGGGGAAAEYKAESISATRQPWQQDPQLNHSSSEEDEDGPAEEEEQVHPAAQARGETALMQRDMFFFVQEDIRLAEGPRLFCCSPHLEEQKEQWEERRSSLRNEYRKKHKEARRKLRSSKRS